MEIKSLSGVVKYTPHKSGTILTIPFQLESLELVSEPKSSKEAKLKKNLISKLEGLYEINFMAKDRNPDISRGDRIKIHQNPPLNDEHLNYIRASQIDVRHGDEVIASYYER